MVVVVAFGAFSVVRLHGLFGSHPRVTDAGNADAIVQFNPKHVVYEVVGPAVSVATVNYLDADAQPQEASDVPLPWSLTLVTTLTAVTANVVGHSAADRGHSTVVVGLARRAGLEPATNGLLARGVNARVTARYCAAVQRV